MENGDRGKMCGTYEEKRKTYSVLVGKREGTRPLGRPRRRWINNNNVVLTELFSEGLTVINLV